MREIDLNLIFSRMRAGWRTPAVLIAIGLMFTLYILAGARPTYHVEMTVIPAPESEVQNGAQVGGAIGSLLGLSGGNQPGSNYVRYQRLLTSPIVAQRMQDHYGMLQKVFKDQWDQDNHRWVAPPSIKRSLLSWLFALAHVPGWTPPDANALSSYLQEKLTIIPSPTSDLVVVYANDRNPEFARRLLLAANAEANGLLRDQVALRARQQVRYLEAKLAQITVADYRAALLTLLSSQEKTLMMTQTDASFAAEIVNPPSWSGTPISPRPVLSIAIAILIGALAGFTLVIFLGPDWWRGPYARLRAWTGGIRRGRNSNSAAARRT